MSDKPFPIVLVAPSGTGKTTICKHILENNPHLKYSISATTRKPRKGEVDKMDYYFISKSVFKDWIAWDKFYEWAEVYGDLYGTLKEPLLEYLNDGCWVLLDLDPQGARSIKRALPETLCIFILPPSIKELRNRLLSRGKEPATTIETRMNAAIEELKHSREFDRVVVNTDLKATVDEIQTIIVADGYYPKKECNGKN